MDKIAAGLEADGLLTGAGGKRWHTSTINKILQNEKYMGDALLQKTITTDFLTKTRIKNNGSAPQYYVENDHEAIIPKDIFLLVQEGLYIFRHLEVQYIRCKNHYGNLHIFPTLIVNMALLRNMIF